ncbi:MAG: hypothetical protein IPN86_00010 [Saprospiraceae bacterium]|nr:hypothetical protein [Saprospiraceae bacterium]
MKIKHFHGCKKNTERFEELPSGTPLYTTKVAVRHNKIGEIGLSYMGIIINGRTTSVVMKRSIHVFALDFNTTLPKTNTFITTECAWVNVDVPKTYSEQFGNKQFGGFLDIVQPVVKRTIAGWKDAVINIAVRFEYVDWNKVNLLIQDQTSEITYGALCLQLVFDPTHNQCFV